MNIKELITVGVAGMAMGVMALDYVEVTDVKARQRYPWNGLVDIDFELDSKATEPYQMQVTVVDNVGKTNLPVKTVYTEGISFKENPCMVHKDTSRILWDAAADLPDGFKCTNVLVTCQDVRAGSVSNLYMIVDLSGGTSAESFPVTYTNCIPKGGWTEDHMTTKLVLRRVEPSSFMMGSWWLEEGHQNNETQHKVTLTKPYYIAIYELTEKQFSLICGGSGTDTRPTLQRMKAIRGEEFEDGYSVTKSTESVRNWNGQGSSYRDTTRYILNITQNKTPKYLWPTTKDVDPNSLAGKLRAKTKLIVDLPTEAQWEYACRGGSASPLNIGESNTTSNAALIKGPEKLDASETHYLYVGNYMPNALGLYDMSGGADEWCLDSYVADLGAVDVVDPDGGSPEIKKTSSSANGSNASYSSSADMTFEGTVWWTIPAGYDVFSSGSCYNHWGVRFTSYSTVRVVRGGSARSASRNNAEIWQRKSSQVKVKGSKVFDTGSADEAKHGIRLVVNVNEE